MTEPQGAQGPIRVAAQEDLKAVGDLVAAAFYHEPVTSWLIPDPQDRHERGRRLFTQITQDVLDAGTVYVYGDYEGAALWMDMTSASDEGEESSGPSPYDEIMGPCSPRWNAFLRLVEAGHPQDPHHYLFITGVLPHLQGRGIGGLMLDHHHSQMPEGTPAYLEATSADSRRLYARHAYGDLDGEPLVLPDDGPPIWPLWITPGTGGPAGPAPL